MDTKPTPREAELTADVKRLQSEVNRLTRALQDESRATVVALQDRDRNGLRWRETEIERNILRGMLRAWARHTMVPAALLEDFDRLIRHPNKLK